MKLRNIVKGFTLIELLVVITIIGILATGATSVYTSQIQKARDATRLSDIKAVQSGIEQFYQDGWVYPTRWAAFNGVTTYVPKLPQDPKSWLASANTVFDYLYNVSQDTNGIPEQEYEVSTTFEQEWNITWKAETDGWTDNYRLEQWINVSDGEQPTVVNWTANWGWAIASSVASLTCILPTSAAAGNCDTAVNPMLIRNQ